MSKNTKLEIVKNTTFRNRKASHDYELLDKYVAGLVLKGTEVKSIRMGKINLQNSFCMLIDQELWVRGLHIAPYEFGIYINHEAKADRKLLLNKKEIIKIKKKIDEKGLTLVPTKIFQNGKGIFKMEIALGRGKKLYDKRLDIKERDMKRQVNRY